MALSGTPWKYAELLRNLVRKDLKVRYQGSALGFLWSLITPIVMILIFYVAFQFVLRVHLENFTLFLIAGLLPWNFFSAASMTSTEAITGNANLVKKIYFPREVLPLSTTLFNFTHFLLALLVFLPALALLDAKVTPALLAFPLLLLLQLVMTLGIALFLSSTTVFFQDIRHMVDLGLMALFWLTPIVYHVSMVPARIQGVFRLGPLTSFVIGYQDIVYWGRWPAPETWLIGVAWAAVAFGIGSFTFRALSPRFAEEL